MSYKLCLHNLIQTLGTNRPRHEAPVEEGCLPLSQSGNLNGWLIEIDRNILWVGRRRTLWLPRIGVHIQRWVPIPEIDGWTYPRCVSIRIRSLPFPKEVFATYFWESTLANYKAVEGWPMFAEYRFGMILSLSVVEHFMSQSLTIMREAASFTF